MGSSEPAHLDSRHRRELSKANKAVEAAIAEAASAANPTGSPPTAEHPLTGGTDGDARRAAGAALA